MSPPRGSSMEFEWPATEPLRKQQSNYDYLKSIYCAESWNRSHLIQIYRIWTWSKNRRTNCFLDFDPVSSPLQPPLVPSVCGVYRSIRRLKHHPIHQKTAQGLGHTKHTTVANYTPSRDDTTYHLLSIEVRVFRVHRMLRI